VCHQSSYWAGTPPDVGLRGGANWFHDARKKSAVNNQQTRLSVTSAGATEIAQSAVVFVIDNDPSMRAALEDLAGSVGLGVRLFASPLEFLQAKRPDAPGCLVLDVRLPGMSGLTFQQELARMGVEVPIIFITGHGDIRMSVRAMKAGAVDFLIKPFQDQDLLDAIHAAIERDCERRRNALFIGELRERYATLTARERQIMARVAIGGPNKQIAAELSLSEMTVKVHRGQVMRKMHARSLPELVRMADQLGEPAEASYATAQTS